MAKHVPQFRIFLSSPGDVQEERDIARDLINNILPKGPFVRGRATFDVVSWDDPDAVPGLPAHLNPQEAINRGMPRPSECDVVIVIFWSRIGTPLPAEFAKEDGSPYQSGTEWEFEDAVNAAKARGKPKVLVYRRSEELKLAINDPELDDKRKQYQDVELFFAQFRGDGGSFVGSFHSYVTAKDFRKLLQQHLEAYASDQLSATQAVETSTPKKNGNLSGSVQTGASPKAKIWNLPHARHPDFIGREGLLETLHNRLTSDEHAGHVQIIQGLSGLGKTQTAIEYAYRHRDTFDLVWWIDSEEYAKLTADLADLGKALNLDDAKATEEQIVIKAVRQWLGDNANYLMIFDNVEDADALRAFLPLEIRGAVLITSRSPAWRGIGEVNPLALFGKTEAVRLLTTGSPSMDASSAPLLAEELGFFTASSCPCRRLYGQHWMFT